MFDWADQLLIIYYVVVVLCLTGYPDERVRIQEVIIAALVVETRILLGLFQLKRYLTHDPWSLDRSQSFTGKLFNLATHGCTFQKVTRSVIVPIFPLLLGTTNYASLYWSLLLLRLIRSESDILLLLVRFNGWRTVILFLFNVVIIPLEVAIKSAAVFVVD